MKLSIIKIGNSKGLRLPKAVLEQCNFEDSVEVTVKDGHLIVSASKSENPRKGWEKAFKAMAKAGDDALLDQDFELDADGKDWQW